MQNAYLLDNFSNAIFTIHNASETLF